MRIAAFGDLHGNVENMDPIYARSEKADLTIVVGDITTFGSPEYAETLIREIQKHSNELLALAGNCDCREINERLDAMGVGIHGKGRVIQGIGFFGVSGSSRTPLHTPFELAESEIEKVLQRGLKEVSNALRKVLVSHAPPYGTRLDIIRSGDHVGSRAIRSFIEQEQPELVLCGHIHESPGTDQLGRTKMVNLGLGRKGCYAIIDIHEGVTIQQFGI